MVDANIWVCLQQYRNRLIAKERGKFPSPFFVLQ